MPDPGLTRAIRYLKSVATGLLEVGVAFGAVMVERGSTDALAMVSCLVATAPPDEMSLDEFVKSSPPPDAVEGTFSVTTVDNRASETVRFECLRRAVLEIPSPDAVSFAVEYLTRLPGSNRMLVTTFSTPNAAEPDRYRALFDSIASSIEVM